MPQRPRHTERVVRMGRAANDNRRANLRPAHMIFLGVGTVLAVLALVSWMTP
jgi:hypothetical protein